MILDEFVEVMCSYQSKEHYLNLGYKVHCSERFTIPISHLPAQSNAKVHVKCDVCGKEKVIKFQVYTNNINHGGFYACSPKCAYSKNRKTSIEKYGVTHPKKSAKVKQTSEDNLMEKYGVKNVFMLKEVQDKITDYNIERYGVINPFQSEELKVKMKETMIEKYGVPYNMQRPEMKLLYLNGKHNNFYIDGRSENDEGIVDSSQHRIWRKAVYERDNYICQCCGYSQGGILNAHHLYSRNLHKDKRNDIENGVTLCKPCHVEFHNTYGYGDNTLEQYQDWTSNVRSNDYSARK